MRNLLLGLVWFVGGTSGCSDLCSQCDAATEVCRLQRGCRFLQNGNPNPFGEPDSVRCEPLPPACVVTDGCPCALCPEGEVNDTCAPMAECIDGAVIEEHGCE